MKLTLDQYEIFKSYINQAHAQRPNCIASIKNWLIAIGDEKPTHYDCLQVVNFAKKASNEAYFWINQLNLTDSHWATVGRKYFKEFKKECGI